MIQVGVVGGTGYVAGELLRILLRHPKVKMNFIYSHSQPNLPISKVHQDLFEFDQFHFTKKIGTDVDVVFLCMGHGQSEKFLNDHPFSKHTRIIDLSNDFRLRNNSVRAKNTFVYGLPELNRSKIIGARHVANPGCFATAIQLALLPLASANLLQSDIHVNATTGSTGAGKTPSATSHFSWRNNNLSIYKPFSHQHLDEINESIRQEQIGFSKAVNFLPQRGNFSRGILASSYTHSDLDEQQLIDIYNDYYTQAAFVRVCTETLHLKQVINTNHALIQVQKIDGKVLITTVIDNLLKGAAGQAVQNMNLMLGISETAGLQLKANYL